jgi:hypothetical protein
MPPATRESMEPNPYQAPKGAGISPPIVAPQAAFSFLRVAILLAFFFAVATLIGLVDLLSF